ncbi:MAG: hypothetical protein DRQ78_01210 [Epsilonproteobacteria bacterium]|nr:MAG: hypothetical protein DRQ78_01210 [Campylobacterota bacterium]
MKNLFLKKIIEIPGISGREEKISKHIEEILVSYDLDIVRDNNGSIYGYKKSEQKNAPVVMVDAHMDEVGFIVTKIEDNGILRLEAMGGISKFSIANSRLRV